MSDTDSLDYLQKSFDPASLTVPRLRSILVSHNIPYPASAKKLQLIELFTQNILPQSRKILSARARARRTSKGITNADQSEDGSPFGDEELMPPPPTPKPRASPRKSSARVRVEDSESETSVPRSPTKRTPRVGSKTVRASDIGTDTDTDPVTKSVRKARKSEAPIIKSEPEEEATPRRPVVASAFSYDNPFQSGSSPPSGSKTPSGESRRKSAGPASSTKDLGRRKSESTRRRTDGPIKSSNEGSSPTSKKYEIPVSKLNGLVDVDDNGVEANEEFTPEEQLELMRDDSAKGLNAISRRPKKKVAKGFNATGPIWVILLTLLGGYATWYRQEKVAVGYCGVGREAHPIISSRVELPDWAVQVVEPQCEPCPQHAYCYSNMAATCEADFVLKPHPLSLGGLVPLPPTCEPDGEKVRKVKAVADRAVEELRERRAKFECGSLTDESGAKASSVEIEEEELKAEVGKKRRRGMGEQEFEELWAGAIGEIKGREEVESRSDGTFITSPNNKHQIPSHKLSSSSLARVPLPCAIRRSARLALARHRLQIASVVALIGFLAYGWSRFSQYKTAQKRVPELVDITLDRLSHQASLHVADRESYPEGWISIGQLRDNVLRSEHNISKRKALWDEVRKVVEMNANVRASQRESRNGEISMVWEWIGAVNALEESLGASRRKSGRVSFYGGDVGGSPVSGSDDGPEMVHSKWQERPMY